MTTRQSIFSVRLAALALLLVAADASAADTFLSNGVTAHRGNSSEFPENTLPAFADAVQLGADWIELDIFRTKDGRLVVIHDPTTARTGDRNLTVSDSTLAELQSVDVATDFRRRTHKTLQECPPEKIPLLEDVLRLIMRQEQTRVSIQPKMDCVAEAVAEIRKLGAQRWCGFNDGSLALMSKVKHLAPELPVFWDRGSDADIGADLPIARDRKFEMLVLHRSGITSEKIARIRGAGLDVGAWTVNDRTEMAKLLDLGVTRLYTDHPRRLLALRSERAFQPVQCTGAYRHHLQGVCIDGRDSIFWSFTTELVKTDSKGKVLVRVPVANHHGDLCFHNNRIYVAVNLGRFNRPAGQADSWVYVYDAGTLKEVARHKTPEVVHGAGGIAWQGDRFIVVGGLPEKVDENYLYEYDASFNFRKRHVLASGYTLMGIQTVAYADGNWWFGCYGKPSVLLQADESFQNIRRFTFNASVGIVPAGCGRFLIGRNTRAADQGCNGSLILTTIDDSRGLKETP